MEGIICKDVSETLKLITDPNYYDDESFMKIVAQVNSILKTCAVNRNVTVSDVKEHAGLSSIMVLMTQACRHGLQATQLENLLKDLNFSNKRTDLLIKLHESIRSSVTLELDSTGNHMPHIVAANWSLDYCLKDSGSERVNALEFLVDLETQGVEGEEGNVQLTCTLPEMQDLVAQLRDASKHIDKLASG